MTIKEKIKRCEELINLLVNVKNPLTHERTKRYYFVLKIYWKLKDKYSIELDNICKKEDTIIKSNKCYFDLPELKITCNNYERSKKRIENQIKNKFKNR